MPAETFGAYGQEAWDFLTEEGRKLMALRIDTRTASIFVFVFVSATERGNSNAQHWFIGFSMKRN
jgi:hypothetical protein